MIGDRLARSLLKTGFTVIGIDRVPSEIRDPAFFSSVMDLSDYNRIKKIIEEQGIDRVIHLAGLAHARNGRKYRWEDYYRSNVECSENVFRAAASIPVLFISTVDVYGFTDGAAVKAEDRIHPFTDYAKSKALAEEACRKLPHYSIFRFSPVYSESEKRDVRKRYYLKDGKLAYLIGKGKEYEVLNIDLAVQAMISWCRSEPKNEIRIIKDDRYLLTAERIKEEKTAGRAKLVLHVPEKMARAGYCVLKTLTGRNQFTYLLNKAVNPLRTE